jgi:hypothetical protein
MQTTNDSSASIASIIAAAALEAGTYITEASQLVFSLAYIRIKVTSLTFLKTGKPRWTVPALAGEIPPTILVPYSNAFSVWKVPCFPVIP